MALHCLIRGNGFPDVLYRLWPIGMAASHLEVITKRGRTQMTWLWPGKMKSIEGFCLACCMKYISDSYICI